AAAERIEIGNNDVGTVDEISVANEYFQRGVWGVRDIDFVIEREQRFKPVSSRDRLQLFADLKRVRLEYIRAGNIDLLRNFHRFLLAFRIVQSTNPAVP